MIRPRSSASRTVRSSLLAPWVVLSACGIAAFAMLHWVALTTHNPRLIPGMVLIGVLIIPVSLIAALRGPKRLRSPSDVTNEKAAGVAFAGGCVSISLAALLEQITLEYAVLPLTLVGPIEEAAKLVVILCALLWFLPATPRNGLIIGAACGAGFAVIETLGYISIDYARSGNQFAVLESDLVWRSLLLPVTHLAWSATLGCVVATAASKNWNPRWIVLAIATYLAVAVIHSAWDLYPTLAVQVTLTALNLALLAISAHCSWRRSPRHGWRVPISVGSDARAQRSTLDTADHDNHDVVERQ